VDKPLNEKIDVWSLGMNMYALLTGVNPFYNDLTEEEVQQKVADGEKPFVDPRYRSRSFAEGQLIEIMELCWTYDADDRPDVFEIARRLRAAYQINQHRQAENGETKAATAASGTLPFSA
jgi:serine/threonine protein kinase